MTVRIDADLLIPGTGEPIPNGTVILEGAGITYAGPTAAAPPTPGAEVTTVPTVMPGMWESHGHFLGITNPDFERVALESRVTQAARATADAKATLDGGITTVREMGGLGINLRRAIAEGFVPGPNIYCGRSRALDHRRTRRHPRVPDPLGRRTRRHQLPWPHL